MRPTIEIDDLEYCAQRIDALVLENVCHEIRRVTWLLRAGELSPSALSKLADRLEKASLPTEEVRRIAAEETERRMGTVPDEKRKRRQVDPFMAITLAEYDKAIAKAKKEGDAAKVQDLKRRLRFLERRA